MKLVSHVIQVPSGEYCWDPATLEICGHFDNESGRPRCTAGFTAQWQDARRDCRKDPDCLVLKDAEPHA